MKKHPGSIASAFGARLLTCPNRQVSRRDLLRMALALGATGFLPTRLAAQNHAGPDSRGPTAEQMRGPFYPEHKPADGGTDLTRLPGRAGQALGPVIYVSGSIVNVRGEPCPGVHLEIWQANAAGRYTHPNDRNRAPLDPNFDGYANITTDHDGRYRFRTVKPGAYPVSAAYWRPPHIHFDIAGRLDRLVTQMYFAGEPLNAKDPLLQQSWAKDSLIARITPPTANEEPGSQRVLWDIVLLQG